MSSFHITVGIDPGAKGAIAFLGPDGAILDIEDMPQAKGAALGAHLADLVADHQPCTIVRAFVEEVESRPGQGHIGPFRQGENFGAICATLGALRIPVELVRPNAWKQSMRCTAPKGTSKAAAKTLSRQRAVEMWPASSALFARVKDDGRAEAALLGRYGWLRGDWLPGQAGAA